MNNHLQETQTNVPITPKARQLSVDEAISLLVNATYSDEWQGNEDLATAQQMAIDALKR